MPSPGRAGEQACVQIVQELVEIENPVAVSILPWVGTPLKRAILSLPAVVHPVLVGIPIGCTRSGLRNLPRLLNDTSALRFDILHDPRIETVARQSAGLA